MERIDYEQEAREAMARARDAYDKGNRVLSSLESRAAVTFAVLRVCQAIDNKGLI